MKKIKQYLIKIFNLPNSMLLCFVIFSAVSLVFICLQNIDKAIFSYVIYMVSAYSLAAVCFKIPKAYRALNNIAQNYTFSRKYITDYEYRAQISLYFSFLINVIYSTFKLVVGLFYSSYWWISIAAYYMILAATRFSLVKYVRIHFHNRNLKEEFTRYKMCGFFLFIINIAFTGVVMQMILQDKSYNYPGFLIYAVAAYTFYNVTVSTVNLIKHRKLENPVLSAANSISLVNALSSLIALETAMFNQFGENLRFKQLMIGLTGFSVCILIFVLALFMLKKGNKMLKKLNKPNINRP